MKITTIPTHEIARRNAAAGSHFFSADTLRFFRSRISGDAFLVPGSRDAFFVTSEKRGFRNNGRAYTVRHADLITGRVETAGGFLGYGSRSTATSAARRLAAFAP